MINIEIFPVLLPLFIASLVFAFVCFGHLAFKNVSIKKNMCGYGGIVGAIYVVLY